MNIKSDSDDSGTQNTPQTIYNDTEKESQKKFKKTVQKIVLQKKKKN